MENNNLLLNTRWSMDLGYVALKHKLSRILRAHHDSIYNDPNQIIQQIHQKFNRLNWYDYENEELNVNLLNLGNVLADELTHNKSNIDGTTRWDLRGFVEQSTELAFIQFVNFDLSYLNRDQTHYARLYPNLERKWKEGIAQGGFFMSTFENCCFENNDLSNILDLGWKVNNCKFSNVIFFGATMGKSFLNHCLFTNCDIRPKGFKVSANNCIFENCDMRGRYFSYVKYSNTIFKHCDLRKSKHYMEDSKFDNVTFINCNLKGAINFPIPGAHFINCKM